MPPPPLADPAARTRTHTHTRAMLIVYRPDATSGGHTVRASESIPGCQRKPRLLSWPLQLAWPNPSCAFGRACRKENSRNFKNCKMVCLVGWWSPAPALPCSQDRRAGGREGRFRLRRVGCLFFRREPSGRSARGGGGVWFPGRAGGS